MIHKFESSLAPTLSCDAMTPATCLVDAGARPVDAVVLDADDGRVLLAMDLDADGVGDGPFAMRLRGSVRVWRCRPLRVVPINDMSCVVSATMLNDRRPPARRARFEPPPCQEAEHKPVLRLTTT